MVVRRPVSRTQRGNGTGPQVQSPTRSANACDPVSRPALRLTGLLTSLAPAEHPCPDAVAERPAESCGKTYSADEADQEHDGEVRLMRGQRHLCSFLASALARCPVSASRRMCSIPQCRAPHLTIRPDWHRPHLW
jgi:hypothetical protein